MRQASLIVVERDCAARSALLPAGEPLRWHSLAHAHGARYGSAAAFSPIAPS